ncbi:hypothetical protein ACQP2U_42925 (plasmid) [Nocardia sp. CA-084685]|uniref:hypothetical protein n=1 Tax=Nocardia sp. CA-084685 TaxID=3239970 RepID=UPI003D9999D7
MPSHNTKWCAERPRADHVEDEAPEALLTVVQRASLNADGVVSQHLWRVRQASGA